MRHSKGFRSRTRHKLRKNPRDRGKVSIRKYLQSFNIGDKVIIKHEPSVHKGMPHPRFLGKLGEIVGKRGKAYLVKVKDYAKEKIVISLPIHLKRVK